jgi:hypothetical protein
MSVDQVYLFFKFGSALMFGVIRFLSSSCFLIPFQSLPKTSIMYNGSFRVLSRSD